MITIYGTPICKDCLAAKIVFERLDVDYKYINITSKTSNLREFLAIRDKSAMYEKVRENNGIGIPLFVKGDNMTFDINEALNWEGIKPVEEEELSRITAECQLLLK